MDGKLIAFAEEERFTRLKGSRGFFPGKAIEYCLREGKLGLSDVHRIAFAWDPSRYPYRVLGAVVGQYLKYRSVPAQAYTREKSRSSVVTGFANFEKQSERSYGTNK